MSSEKNANLTAAKAAFPYTLPILAGFLFLGAAYGVYMRSLGFSAVYPIIMSMTIFAGSMEFLAADLLTRPFDPVNALVLTLMVNARHIFYGISMLDKYKGTGKLKPYLIFGMCDESFSINCTAEIGDNVDKGKFMFFVTLFNQLYWVTGATLGAVFGGMISIGTEGIDFVMTALFIVIFMDNLNKEKDHASSVTGLAVSLICLLIFGGDRFIVASMAGIMAVLAVRYILSFGRKEEKE
ncbi:MAG: AzlC family ABC transporter permease [Huintestinicola sp.]